jgi:hypothetical protein
MKPAGYKDRNHSKEFSTNSGHSRKGDAKANFFGIKGASRPPARINRMPFTVGERNKLRKSSKSFEPI